LLKATLKALLLCWNVKQDIAKKIGALAKFLGPAWLPLWEEVGGRWRLVFISPQLIARYKELLRFPYSH
jgi:hypothetical protein